MQLTHQFYTKLIKNYSVSSNTRQKCKADNVQNSLISMIMIQKLHLLVTYQKRFGSILDSLPSNSTEWLVFSFEIVLIHWEIFYKNSERFSSKMLYFISEAPMEPLLWNSHSMHANCANFTPKIPIIWFNTWTKNTTFLIFCLFHVWLTDVQKDLKVCTNKAVTKNTNIGSMVYFACTVENWKKMHMHWNGTSRISTQIKQNWTMLVTNVIIKLIHRYVTT